MPTHIYQRPLIEQSGIGTPIYLVGMLADYSLGEAYEGRLQIVNSIGPHFVKQVGGDRLPDGTSITVDEETSEVVVNWPPLVKIPGTTNTYAAPIRNADFEGTKGWEFGQGWKISTDSIHGAHSAEFNNFNGVSVCSHTSRYKVNPGRAITAKCQVRQGASAKYNVGARIILEWRDDLDNVVLRSEGNIVDDASKGRVYPSTVTATPPPGATQVNVGFLGVRNRENKALWLDDVQWDHVVIDVTEPVNPSEEYFLELQVIDSLGRAATWSGSISMAGTYTTSKLYGFYDREDITTYGVYAEWIIRDLPVTLDNFDFAGQFLDFDIKTARRNYDHPAEDAFDFSSVFVEFDIRAVLKKHDQPWEDSFDTAPDFVAFNIKNNPRVTQPWEDSLDVAPAYVAMEFGT